MHHVTLGFGRVRFDNKRLHWAFRSLSLLLISKISVSKSQQLVSEISLYCNLNRLSNSKVCAYICRKVLYTALGITTQIPSPSVLLSITLEGGSESVCIG